MRTYAAEFIRAFWLVLGGCGSAVLATGFPGLGTGFVGVPLAFGLTVLTMAYAIALCLTLMHLISIAMTNTSVNPACSNSMALFEQLWLFWAAPIAGALVGTLAYGVIERD